LANTVVFYSNYRSISFSFRDMITGRTTDGRTMDGGPTFASVAYLARKRGQQ